MVKSGRMGHEKQEQVNPAHATKEGPFKLAQWLSNDDIRYLEVLVEPGFYIRDREDHGYD